MTLLDYPERTACTIFLGGCNFRCPWRHNSSLIHSAADPAIARDDLLSFLHKRRDVLDGVAVSGGEPLLYDLRPLLTEIKTLGYAVKLDTNGAHPERLRELLDAGLVDSVAMDIKNSPERYAETIGLPTAPLEQIQESIAVLLNNTVDYTFRTTVISEFHDADSFHGIGRMVQGAKRHDLQAFVNRDSVPRQGLTPPSIDTLRTYAEILRLYVRTVKLRGVSAA